ncbi:hypothetical protein WEI85_06170 [Actinomycetes bacterium KLBMP 9797]
MNLPVGRWRSARVREHRRRHLTLWSVGARSDALGNQRTLAVRTTNDQRQNGACGHPSAGGGGPSHASTVRPAT